MKAILLFLVSGLSFGVAAAAPIKVAFHNAASQETAMAPENPPFAQGSVADTGRDHWNHVTRPSSTTFTFSGIALTDAAGVAGGATLSGTSGYAGGKAAGYPRTDKDAVMMEGWFGFRAAESLTVAGLPEPFAAGFHVIVYGDADNDRTMRYTIGGSTRTVVDSGTFDGDFAEDSEFAVFAGLSGTSFTLTGNPGASEFRSAVSGLVIVPGDPPAPPVVESFVADKRYVSPGSAVTLSWRISGADSVSIEPGIGPVAAGGSREVTVGRTTEFTLTAVNSDGETKAALRIGAGPPRPNVVVFLVDDMGAMDTSVPFFTDASGADVVTDPNRLHRTPHMEALAADGMKFTTACALPVCSPTRVSLMTGQNSARHHVTNWTHWNPGRETGNAHPTHASPAHWRRTGIPVELATLPGHLRDAGYRTIHVGKAHFGNDDHARDPLNLGFDVNVGGTPIGQPGSYSGDYGAGGTHAVPHLGAYHGTGTHLSDALTLEMNRAIGEAVADGVPFFAYMSHYAVHAPFQADPRFAGNYPGLSGQALAFATLIEGMDKSLGDLRAKLAELGVAEDTLVFFAGDNGSDSPTGAAPLRHIKGSKYEGGTRIPLIASWAARDGSNEFQKKLPIPAASRTTDRVAIFDLHPTILAVTGAEGPEHATDAHDLSRHLRGEEGVHRPQRLLIHLPHHHRSAFFTIWYEGSRKLIHNYVDGSFELYDLASDPSEQNDLSVAEPGRLLAMARGMARELRSQGAQWPRLISTGEDVPFRMPPAGDRDSDGDGVPDSGEDGNWNGIVDPGETDPDRRDTDGDGTPDGAELRLGTDPLDAASSFRAMMEFMAGGPRLVWPSAPGSFFTIRSSADLSDWSRVIVSGLPAAPAPADRTGYNVGPVTEGPRFFRVHLDGL